MERIGQTYPCPWCGTQHDSHTGVGRTGERPPQFGPGAISMCIRCGGFMVVEAAFIGIAMRLPTETEAAEIAADPKAIAMRASFRDAFGREPAGA